MIPNSHVDGHRDHFGEEMCAIPVIGFHFVRRCGKPDNSLDVNVPSVFHPQTLGCEGPYKWTRFNVGGEPSKVERHPGISIAVQSGEKSTRSCVLHVPLLYEVKLSQLNSSFSGSELVLTLG